MKGDTPGGLEAIRKAVEIDPPVHLPAAGELFWCVITHVSQHLAGCRDAFRPFPFQRFGPHQPGQFEQVLLCVIEDIVRHDALEVDRREDLVRQALAMVDETDRQIVLMTMVEGRKPGDIAAKLGLSSEVVRQRKSRAIKKISEFVKGLSRSAQNDYHD